MATIRTNKDSFCACILNRLCYDGGMNKKQLKPLLKIVNIGFDLIDKVTADPKKAEHNKRRLVL